MAKGNKNIEYLTKSSINESMLDTDKIDPAGISGRISAVQKALGIWEADFGSTIGICRTGLLKLKNGSFPSSRILFSLHEMYGVDLLWLVYGSHTEHDDLLTGLYTLPVNELFDLYNRLSYLFTDNAPLVFSPLFSIPGNKEKAIHKLAFLRLSAPSGMPACAVYCDNRSVYKKDDDYMCNEFVSNYIQSMNASESSRAAMIMSACYRLNSDPFGPAQSISNPLPLYYEPETSIPSKLIGKRLDEARTHTGMSQTEFKDFIGLTFPGYIKVRDGGSSPSGPVMERIVNFLHTDLRWFLFGVQTTYEELCGKLSGCSDEILFDLYARLYSFFLTGERMVFTKFYDARGIRFFAKREHDMYHPLAENEKPQDEPAPTDWNLLSQNLSTGNVEDLKERINKLSEDEKKLLLSSLS